MEPEDADDIRAAVAVARGQAIDDLWTWGWEACAHMSALSGSDPGGGLGGCCATRGRGDDPTLTRCVSLEIVHAPTRNADVSVPWRAEPRIAERGRGRGVDRGRVIYVGAGTGGRLAAMDACEWGPTYGVPDDAVITLVAGEGLPPGSYEDEASEDDAAGGAAAVRALAPSAARHRGWSVGERLDAVRGRRARGGARRRRADRCGDGRVGSSLGALVDIAIELPVGDEVVSGLDAAEGRHRAEDRPQRVLDSADGAARAYRTGR